MAPKGEQLAAAWVAVLGDEALPVLRALSHGERLKLLRALQNLGPMSEVEWEKCATEIVKNWGSFAKATAFSPNTWLQRMAQHLPDGGGALRDEAEWGALQGEIRETALRLSPHMLVQALLRESPSVGALLLLLMPPEHGALVLKASPRDAALKWIQNALGRDTGAGVAADRETHECLLVFLQGLAKGALAMGHPASKGGLSGLLQQWEGLGREQQEGLMARLLEHDPQLAAQLESQLLTVEKLAQLATSDRAIVCMAQTESDRVLVLGTTDEGCREAWLTSLSLRKAEEIREAIACRPRVPQKERDEARQRWVDKAKKMQAEGKIRWPWEGTWV